MATLSQRALAAINRFNAAHPWSHNTHYHRWILRHLPRRPGAVLDVGSGAGVLARRLATRAGTVHAVDADEAITARARALTDPGTAVTFTVGDALTDLPPGPFAAVTCVAALHHLPLAPALTVLRDRLAPGGRLIIVGLAVPDTPGDHLLGALAVPANLVMGWVHNGGRPGPRPASMTAPVASPTHTLAQIRAEARRLLPGARLRRRLFWRYTLLWQRPAGWPVSSPAPGASP